MDVAVFSNQYKQFVRLIVFVLLHFCSILIHFMNTVHHVAAVVLAVGTLIFIQHNPSFQWGQEMHK